MDVYTSRLEELVQKIEGKLKEIPYIDKLLEIKGIGMVTVSGFIAEVGDIRRFDNPKQLQKACRHMRSWRTIQASIMERAVSATEEEND